MPAYSLKAIETAKRVGRIFDAGCDRCDISDMEYLEARGLMVRDAFDGQHVSDTLEEGEEVWTFNKAGRRLVDTLLTEPT